MPHVMVVDDAIDTCEALTKFLQRSGHRVTCAATGKQALSDLIREMPDVMVLDLMMPGMDGASLLAIVRSYLRLQSLPVVVLTALPDSPLVDAVRQLGVERVLVKGKATLEDVRHAVDEVNRPAPNGSTIRP